MNPIDITKTVKSKKLLNSPEKPPKRRKDDKGTQYTTYPCEVGSQAEANALFVKKYANQGMSGSMGAFIELANRCLQLYPSFSLSEFVQENRKFFGIDFFVLEQYFHRWTEEMCRLHIIEQMNGSCYDDGKRFIRLA